jgi:hypothetical protein
VESPETSEYSAMELKNKIDEYRKNMLTIYEGGMKEIMEHTMGITTYDFPPLNGVVNSWTIGNFYETPLAAVIPLLSKIQADTRQAESDALLYLYDQLMLSRQ